MKRKRLFMGAFLFPIYLFSLMFSSMAGAETKKGFGSLLEFTGDEIILSEKETYSVYIERLENKQVAQQEIEIDVGLPKTIHNAEIKSPFLDRQSALMFSKDGGYAEYSLTAPEGLYQMEFDYCASNNNKTDLYFGVMVDGEYPFKEAENIFLPRVWQDIRPIMRDWNDNDLLPIQKEIQSVETKRIHDKQGLIKEPYLIYMPGGEVRIRILCEQDNLIIVGIRLCPPEKLPSYNDYLSQIEQVSGGKTVKHEAEVTYKKSDSTLYPRMDRTSAATSPSDPVKLRYNTIGQNSFSHIGQWIEWEVEVPETGLYNLTFRVRQNFSRGMISHRAVRIDGQLLFKGLDDIQFPYDKNFYMKTLGDEEPWQFYLTKGKHLIRMEVVTSDIAGVLRAVNDASLRLNDIYRELLMLVGPNPDPFMDYYVEKQIPDLLPQLSELSNLLKDQKRILDSMSNKGGSGGSVIEKMYVMIDSMILKPETIPYRLSTFQSNISAVSAWVSDISAQPLEIDYLLLSKAGEPVPKAEKGFVEQLWFGIRAIAGSFFEDYSSIGKNSAESGIKVWVGLGRDQAQVIRDIVSSYFETEYKTAVDIALVQGSILEATMAGKGPDIALFVGDAMPMNLAVRGALVDLSGFEGFQDITKRFSKTALQPYLFNGGCYGLPLTQDFPVMFYRKDVLKKLGINRVPATWEEFYQILPVIQRANLSVGVGDTNVSQTNASRAPNFGTVFPALILQRNESIYKGNFKATNFDNEIVVKSFEEWTNLYTLYDLPLEYDFFNRFRTGEMPLAFASYTSYNQIMLGAPEIRGLWDIAMIPGTKTENGIVRHDVATSGSSGVIVFTKAKNWQACFSFVDWLTSDEIQALYGNTIESILGNAARYNTANLNAIQLLPWTAKEFKTLKKQMDFVVELPVIPSTYYVNRQVTNAFRDVVYNRKNPRETLRYYDREIMKEITRKNRELGLD